MSQTNEDLYIMLMMIYCNDVGGENNDVMSESADQFFGLL